MKNKIIITILILLGFALLLPYSIQKTEKNECLKWREEAGVYDNYYVTDWQIEQCEHYNLPLR